MIMWCREATELMTDDMEGRLDASKSRAFRLHVALCPYCRAHRRQLETTIATLGRMPVEPSSDASRERALAEFRSKKKPPA